MFMAGAVFMWIYMYIYIHTHIHTHTYIHTYIHTCRTTVGMFMAGAVFMWITEGDRDNEDYKVTHRYAYIYLGWHTYT